MARVAVPRGIVSADELTPRPPRTRVVSCRLSSLLANVITHTYTEIVGQNIILLAVDVWLDVHKPSVNQAIAFDMFTGTTEPVNSADVANWEPVLPIFERGAVTNWLFCGGVFSKHWDTSFPYTGAGRRFAVRAIPSANLVGSMLLSFRVLEG